MQCDDGMHYSGIHRACGDKWCSGDSTLDPETCLTCPQDCGTCDPGWVVEWRDPGWLRQMSFGVWGSSPTDVYIVGSSGVKGGDQGTIVHFNGVTWRPIAAGKFFSLQGVWGASASDVFAVGKAGTVVHNDGMAWSPMKSNCTRDLLRAFLQIPDRARCVIWAPALQGARRANTGRI